MDAASALAKKNESPKGNNTPKSLEKSSARRGNNTPPPQASNNPPPPPQENKNLKQLQGNGELKPTLDSTDSKIVSKKDSIIVKNPFADTTSIKYINAYHNVKIHRSNLQGVCDSLIFTSLDSIARLYRNPVLWHENYQFSGDSIQLLIQNKQLSKVELMSNAFTITKEDSTHFNQIKAVDIVGYFTKNELSRFDALGSASVIFFIAEDSILTTMNQKECRAIKAIIENNSLKRVKYIQDVSDNAFPLLKLEKNKQRFKGFNWDETIRPKNRFEVCYRKIYETERESAKQIPLPMFSNTNRFFKFKTRFSPDIKR